MGETRRYLHHDDVASERIEDLMHALSFLCHSRPCCFRGTLLSR